MKFSIKDFFSRCDQIRSFLRNWSYLLKEFLMENSIFCAVINKNFLSSRIDAKYHSLNFIKTAQSQFRHQKTAC